MPSMVVARPICSESRKTGSRSLAISAQDFSKVAPINSGCFLLATGRYGSLYNTTLCGPLQIQSTAFMRGVNRRLLPEHGGSTGIGHKETRHLSKTRRPSFQRPKCRSRPIRALENCTCSLIGKSSTHVRCIPA